MMTFNLYIVLALTILGVGKCQSDMDDLFLEAVSAPQIEPATVGFYDLSGKKWEGTYSDTAEGLYKRGLSGFMGVRGKKADETFFGYEKKSIPSGFMGVRGKKKTYFPFYMSYKSDTRMPPMFTAMREKNDGLDGEQLPLGFYGLRGR